MYWSLLRLQKTDYSVIEQFCISRSSYELYVKIRKRDTHLHETSHTTSSTQQRYMHLQKKFIHWCNWSLLGLQKKQWLVIEQSCTPRRSYEPYLKILERHIYTKYRTLLAPQSNVICKFMNNFNTLVYWSLLRLQKQSRLLCDRTILQSEEQLWTITEDTEAPHLHETLHTTSSTQQRYMQIHENLQYPGVLINTKAAKTKQTTLWSNNFALRVAVMNHKWRYGSATHIYTKHRTLLAPHSNVICIIKKNSYIGVLIIIQAAKKNNNLWSNNFALRAAVMNHNWRYRSSTSTRNIAHY